MKTRATLYALLLLLATTTPAYAQTSGPMPLHPFVAMLYGALAVQPLRYLLQYDHVSAGQSRQSFRAIAASIVLGLFTIAYLAMSLYPFLLYWPQYWSDYQSATFITFLLLTPPVMCQLAHWAFSAQKYIFQIWPKSDKLPQQLAMIAACFIVTLPIWLFYFLISILLSGALQSLVRYDDYSSYQSIPDKELAAAIILQKLPTLEGLFWSLFCLLCMGCILALHPVRYLRAYRHEISVNQAQKYLALASYAWLAFLGVGYGFMILRVLFVYRVFD